jgi:hypothetical protein
MPLDQVFQRQKCARCRQTIQSDPVFEDNLWITMPVSKRAEELCNTPTNSPPASALCRRTRTPQRSSSCSRDMAASGSLVAGRR